jgi:hypothetical protein
VDPTAWAGLLSPVGCVVYLIVALSRGWLVSGREMDRHQQIWEARLDEKDERLAESHERETVWRTTALTTEETRRDVADQLRTRQIIDEVLVRSITPTPAPDGV